MILEVEQKIFESIFKETNKIQYSSSNLEI